MCMELYHGDEDYRDNYYLGKAIRPSIDQEEDYDKDDEYYACIESKTDNEPAWA